MTEPRPFGAVPSGRQLPRQFPDDTLGEFDTWRRATPHRVESARRYFIEMQPGDFEQVTPRLLRHLESGVECRIDGSDPLALANPRTSEVSAFYVQGERLVFLRPATAWTTPCSSAPSTRCGCDEERPEHHLGRRRLQRMAAGDLGLAGSHSRAELRQLVKDVLP